MAYVSTAHEYIPFTSSAHLKSFLFLNIFFSFSMQVFSPVSASQLGDKGPGILVFEAVFLCAESRKDINTLKNRKQGFKKIFTHPCS